MTTVREGGCVCGALRFRTRGEPSRTVESGRWIHLYFCQRCGATIHSRWPEDKGELALLGGTFDDTGWITVSRHVWTRSRQKSSRG